MATSQPGKGVTMSRDSRQLCRETRHCPATAETALAELHPGAVSIGLLPSTAIGEGIVVRCTKVDLAWGTLRRHQELRRCARVRRARPVPANRHSSPTARIRRDQIRQLPVNSVVFPRRGYRSRCRRIDLHVRRSIWRMVSAACLAPGMTPRACCLDLGGITIASRSAASVNAGIGR